MSDSRDNCDSLETVSRTTPSGRTPAVKMTLPSNGPLKLLQKSSDSNQPRGSTRQQKSPGRWRKVPTALLTASSHISLFYSQTTKGDERESWKNAIKSETHSLYKNKTCVLVPGSQARNVFSDKWILGKMDTAAPDGGTYMKTKARLVTSGFQQLQGIDYEQTFPQL